MSKFDNEIVRMYQSGISVKEICGILPCSRQTIYNALNRHNVKLDYTRGKRNDGVSVEKIYEMYELYLQGKNTREIGEIYGFSKSHVSRLFSKHSLTLRDQHQTSRKYTLNENFFDSIDTEEKAYFLGLLWADGTNIINRNCVQIGLQKKDKHILETMLSAMNANSPLKCTKSTYPGG